MTRKIMSSGEINAVSEKIIDMLSGMPVSNALNILKITENNLLYLSTVEKPERRHVPDTVDLEEYLGKAKSFPIIEVR